ncbi:MAG TPA: 1-deoxy-D-xylulose-5-phosphate reductoisomerase, partial [Verrucomicrobiae bacterium]|nr:1-deoxy-D-xylulose-5-phosphate reductoisomerase [Verrucomicrobiae bacterium]
MKKLSILGSTGSIGTSTLDIVRAHPDRFRVLALTAGGNLELLGRQIQEFAPEVAAVLTEEGARELTGMLGPCRTEILHGAEGLIAAATVGGADTVVAAIVGAAGLIPTAAAIQAGKDVALANKETLVCAGRLIMDLVKEKGVRLLPVDSEHSAVFQSLQGHRGEDVKRIVLTASGGPFLHLPAERLAEVSVEEALAHPNWSMGRKITVDSATMMNKGLEVIEARWLFDIPPERIDVHVHPQSVIHSMVEYVDGCVIAQLGVPDMKAPIAYALTWPERVPTGVRPLDLTTLSRLDFHEPDLVRFPALRLAYDAMRGGEDLPAVMNAANEVAVTAFLEGRIRFSEIPVIIERTMASHVPGPLRCI